MEGYVCWIQTAEIRDVITELSEAVVRDRGGKALAVILQQAAMGERAATKEIWGDMLPNTLPY